MSKTIDKLSGVALKELTKPGYYFDGQGLYLQVRKGTGTRSWIFRFMINGRDREMGLGSLGTLSLAEARRRRKEERQLLDKGLDPIEARRATKAAQSPAERPMTFDEAAAECIRVRAAKWTNAKHAAQWTSSLTTYASPVFGGRPVAAVDVPHILAALEPIWHTKVETATRLRERIAAVLDWATARGHRTGVNPARWKGHMETLLGGATPEQKKAKVKHHASLPHAAISSFMRDLKTHEGNGARALEFAILTAARSGEVRGATWGEIDVDAAIWTVPASRMKQRVEHRVPLSKPAVALLRSLPRGTDDGLVFPAPRGGQLSDMTLSAVTRRMNVDAVPHGFRATFKTWTAEATDYPPHIVEMALAHALENKVEAAYLRTDMMERRAALMADWAAYCLTQRTPAKVLPIRKKATAEAVA